MTIVLIGGDDVECSAGTLFMNSTTVGNSVSVSGLSFQPNMTFMGTSGMGNNTSSPLSINSFGVAVNNGGTIETIQTGMGSQNSGSTSTITGSVHNNRTIAQNHTVQWDAEITAFNSDGFDLTVRNGSPSTDYVHYLCVKSGTKLKAATFTSPSSTGDFSLTGMGFKPQFALLGMGLWDTVNTYTTDNDGAVFAIGVMDGQNEYLMGIRDEDGLSTTNSGSLSVDKAVKVLNYDGVPEYEDSYEGSNDAALLLNGTNLEIGQVFQASKGGKLTGCEFYLRKGNSPTGNGVAKLYAITGTPGTNAVPTGSALATSESVDMSTTEAPPTWKYFEFDKDNQYDLTASTWYAIVVDYTGTATNNVGVRIDNTSPSHGGNPVYYNTSWNSATSSDCLFRVHCGGMYEGSFKSFDSGGFTLDITTEESAETKKWAYLALGEEYVVDEYDDSNQNTSSAFSSTNAKIWKGQSFQAAASGKLTSIDVSMDKSSAPTGDVTVKLYRITGSSGSHVPTGSALATSDIVDASVLPSSIATYKFTFSDGYVLAKDEWYCFIIDYQDGTSSVYIAIGQDNTSPSHAGNWIDSEDGSTWRSVSGQDVAGFAVNVTAVDEQTEDSLDSTTATNAGNSLQSNNYLGQVFKATKGGKLSSVEFVLSDTGSPTGEVVAYLYAITGTPGTNAKPTGSILATSEPMDASTVTDNEYHRFVFNGSNRIIFH
jgi:hypothetical protein